MKNLYQLFAITVLCGVMSQQAQAQVYCIPPESTFGGPLSGFTNVQLGTLNNTSANEGYTDYTSTVASVSLQRGSSYTPSFVLYYDMIAQGFTDKMNLRIWIDYNIDGDFNDAGEQVFSMQTVQLLSTTNNPVTGTAFTIPVTATLGITRMRVFSDMIEADGHDTPVPCGYLSSTNTLGQHGEAEDYKVTITSTTGVNEISKSPLAFSLTPNPTNEITTISYTLPANAPVTIEVFNMVGEKVALLANGNEQAGHHNVNLSAADLNLSSGMYFIVITAGQAIETRKLTINSLY